MQQAIEIGGDLAGAHLRGSLRPNVGVNAARRASVLPDLATMIPCDVDAERDVQPAEADRRATMLPHSAGVAIAAMPSAMKQTPIARTTGTLKMPPVNTPAP